MIGLGIVLLVSLQTGSYALAGALSATEALANAAVGPLIGRAIDRKGQHRILPLLTGGQADNHPTRAKAEAGAAA